MQMISFLATLLIGIFVIAELSNAATFDKSEYQARRTKLMESVPDGIAVILGSEGVYQNSNMIYFAGIEEPFSILIIDGMNKRSTLFMTSVESSAKVRKDTGVERVLPLSDLTRQLGTYQAQTKIIYTPIDQDDRGYIPFDVIDPVIRLSREMTFINQIKERYPFFTFKDLNPAIGALRVIKSPAEIEMHRESARISSLAHIEVLRLAEPGMYEWELEALFEYMIKSLGGQGFAYDPIIPSEPKWYNTHYSENSRKILDGEIVMPDVGGEYHYYDTDISATWPINGKFTSEQARLNRIIVAVENAMQEVFRPGITSADLPAEVQAILSKQGIDMEKEGVFAVNANHWIGLDIHDVVRYGPSSRTTPFKPGMILASDPGIRMKDKDGNVFVAVKIENTVLITEDGCENLSRLVPRTVEEIEKVMAEEGIHDYLNERK
jgi:Xaa-Pro aminopeptidase